MPIGLFIAAVSSAFAAQPGLQAPDFSIAVAEKSGTLQITATPPPANHINVEAPGYLELDGSPDRIKAASKTEQKTVFKIPAEKPVRFTVSLYLCDDKKSYCENHKVSGSWQPSTSSTPVSPTSPTPSSAPTPTQKQRSSQAPIPAHKKMETDFLLNQPALALKLARGGKKPLLIDFFGIWCPPCNMLDKDVFGSAEFKKAAAGFVKLKVDSDAPVSWELKSKYKVGGYPTILFATAEGEEILRIVGYRPKELFLKELERAWSLRTEPVTALQAKADSGDLAASERLGMLHLERGEYEAAIPLLVKVPSRQLEKTVAELGVLEKKKSQDDSLLKALETAIQRFQQAPESIEWRSKLGQLYSDRKEPEKHKAVLTDLVTQAKAMIANPATLAGKDYAPADLWASVAQAYEELGGENQTQAREAWLSAAAEFAKGAQGSERERGNNLERAYCLWKGGKPQEAEKIYTTLQKEFPKEFTFWYAHASMKLQTKDPVKAETLARKALKHSYGDNRLRAALLLAKACVANGKKGEARALIASTIEAANLPKDPSLRTHKYVQNLRDYAEALK